MQTDEQLTSAITRDQVLEVVDRHAVRRGHVGATVKARELVDLALGPELGCDLGDGDLDFVGLGQLHS